MSFVTSKTYMQITRSILKISKFRFVLLELKNIQTEQMVIRVIELVYMLIDLNFIGVGSKFKWGIDQQMIFYVVKISTSMKKQRISKSLF
jgi:hypothetical protein